MLTCLEFSPPHPLRDYPWSWTHRRRHRLWRSVGKSAFNDFWM